MTRLKQLAAWAGVIGYMALIFYLSAQQDPLPGLTHNVSDKVLHGCEYAGLALAWLVALRSSSVRPAAAALTAIVAASLYGATDEFHQFFVPGRSSDVLDWLADTTGAAGAGIGYLLLRRWVPASHLIGGGREPARERPLR